MRNMGGLENLMSKMPGELGQISKQIPEGTAEKAMGKVEAIINSMTQRTRQPCPAQSQPQTPYCNGCGTTVQEVNKLLKQFEQMQQMMKMFSGNGLGKLMRLAKGMKGMKGMFPGL